MTNTNNTSKSLELRKVLMAEQRELLRVGDIVLVCLPDNMVTLLNVITERQQRENWEEACRDRFDEAVKNHSRRTVPQIKTALAVSEVALALETLMSGNRGHPDIATIVRNDTNIKVGDHQIPGVYLAGRIAEEASVDLSVALMLWNTIMNLLIDGKIKLPGLIGLQKSEDVIELSREVL